MADFTESRNGQILESIINDEPYDAEPQSRIEELLIELKETIEQGGGGGVCISDNNGTYALNSGYTVSELHALYDALSDGAAVKLPDFSLYRPNRNGGINIYKAVEFYAEENTVMVTLIAIDTNVAEDQRRAVVAFDDEGVESISYMEI